MIKFFVKGQKMCIADTYIVADTIDYLEAEFYFQTSDWADMTKYAHFSCGEKLYDIELIDNKILKSAHLNLCEGEWSVWLHGTRYDEAGEIVERVTANTVRFSVLPTGSTEGGSVFPATPPDVVEQIKADLGDLEKLSTTDKRTLVDAINEVLLKAEGDISAEMIAEAVELYLTKNPIQETDPNVPEWAKQPKPPRYTAADVGALPADTSIPDKTSDLTNDSGFITNMVTDLVNYYGKSETYTQEQVNALVSAIPKFSIEVVSALPTSGISDTTVYLLATGTTDNLYTEYIYVGGTWEVLGTQSVDLTGYATENWVLGKIDEIVIPTKLSELTADSTHRTVTDEEKAIWSGKSNFSGNYDDLSNKPAIPTVPTVVSAFTNDVGYVALSENTFADGETIALQTGNSEWAASGAISTLTVTYPEGEFEAWIKIITAASGVVTVTLPTSKYIGEAPTFGNGEEWELSIKNSVVIAGKCE